MHRFLVLSGLLLAVPGVLAEEAAPAREVHIAADLLDGSLVTGMGPDRPLALVSPWGRLTFRLSDAAAIRVHPDRETVTARMRNGDVVTGVLDPATFAVRDGAAGLRELSPPEFRELRMTPPVTSAGAGGDAWEVSFTGVRGWTTENADGVLTATDIRPVKTTTAGRGDWGVVRLGRAIEPLGDLDLNATIGWDAGSAGRRAMARLVVLLLDDHRNVIAAAGHRDAWVVSTGSAFAQVPGVDATWSNGEHGQPPSGRMRIGISRAGGRIVVSLDGVVVKEGTSTAPVSRVEVQFGFYGYRGPRGSSELGSLTLSRLEFRRAAPEPPAGVFRHAVDGRVTGFVEFRPDGRIGTVPSLPRWTRDGRELVLTWPGEDAPGGAWVDRLTLSPGGRLYSGRNQAGFRVTGERIERAEPVGRLTPLSPRWPLELLPAGLDAPPGALFQVRGEDGVNYLVNRTGGEVLVPVERGVPVGARDLEDSTWRPHPPGPEDDCVLRLAAGRFLAWVRSAD